MKFITGNDVCINKYLTINLRITAGLAEPGWTRHGSTLKPLAVCAEAAGANNVTQLLMHEPIAIRLDHKLWVTFFLSCKVTM